MKLENQVVSLDLAKRLKELGVPQESVFQWVILGGHNPPVVRYEYASAYHALVEASAFTCSELGEMLPWGIEGGNPHHTTMKILKAEQVGWIIYYANIEGTLHQE